MMTVAGLSARSHRATHDPVGHYHQRHQRRYPKGDDRMPPRTVPQTWRLLELFHASAHPCAACGQVPRYLMQLAAVGDCLPVLFPPGVPVPGSIGMEVEVHLAGSVDRSSAHDARSRYREIAVRVRQTSIRCEGCGERFEELEVYRVHACEVRYR